MGFFSLWWHSQGLISNARGAYEPKTSACSQDPAITLKFCPKCDRGGKKSSFLLPNFVKRHADCAHQSLPCPGQARSPWRCRRAWRSWSFLQPFPTSHVLELEDASSHQYVAARSSPLFDTLHAHSVLDALGAGLVMWSMRSSAHLSCLLTVNSCRPSFNI